MIRPRSIGNWLRGASFYLLLAAGVSVLGVCTYMLRIPVGTRAPSATPAQVAKTEEEDVHASSFIASSPLFLRPVRGEAINEEEGALLFCEALGQWQVHRGVDYAAARGEAVRAAADGTVARAYDDALYGLTIELLHADGARTLYANLATINLVQEGAAVKAGEIIASVGDSALAEAGMETHLHFEAYDAEGLTAIRRVERAD